MTMRSAAASCGSWLARSRDTAAFAASGVLEGAAALLLHGASMVELLCIRGVLVALVAAVLAWRPWPRRDWGRSCVGLLMFAVCGAIGSIAAVALLLLFRPTEKNGSAPVDVWFSTLASAWTDSAARRLAADVVAGRAYSTSLPGKAASPSSRDAPASRRDQFHASLVQLPRLRALPQIAAEDLAIAGSAIGRVVVRAEANRRLSEALTSIDQRLAELGAADPSTRLIAAQRLAEVLEARSLDRLTREIVVAQALEIMRQMTDGAGSRPEQTAVEAKLIVAARRPSEGTPT